MPFQSAFDGVGAYKRELIACFAVLGLVLVLVVATKTWRFMRAWWAGITSVTAAVAAAVVVILVNHGESFPIRTWGACGLAIIATIVIERWRWNKPSQRSIQNAEGLKIDIPRRKVARVSEEDWQASSSDDPIEDWEEDLVGRTSVVEVLAEYALLGTPVVALHGGLGDGKSSVFNLLRKALESRVIVVLFSAWLPGSETTLAIDLFTDIASECKKRLYVPELRKRAIAYARTLSGSFPVLAGLKEIFPTESQRDEINELRHTLQRVPLPIVVLIDELDRMQKEELRVLLKILRGISSIPNVTFVCAFSEQELKNRLSQDQELPYDYLEKFFPVTVNLAPPSTEMIARLFRAKLKKMFREQRWFPDGQGAKQFDELLDRLWRDSLSHVCTNFRQAGLLLNDIRTAARPVIREVNALDLTGVECLRRFYPAVYHIVRKNSALLTDEEKSWGKYALDEEAKKKDPEELFKKLETETGKAEAPEAAMALLGLLFPAFASSQKGSLRYSMVRATDRETTEREKRISHPDYFPIYFRSAIPEEMFSTAELTELLSELNRAKSEPAIQAIFDRVLGDIPKGDPKREDFLWKVGRSAIELSDSSAEMLAYAVATRADDYAYDLLNIGEAARALNVVFEVAQKLSSQPIVQQVLLGAMARSSDDTFARRLWEYIRDKERNKVLTDFSKVTPEGVKDAFIARMKARYGPQVPIEGVTLAQGDWWAFRIWAENSDDDRALEQDFWRRYIARSRKKLAQAINLIYPANTTWENDPKLVLNTFFPIEEAKQLFQNLTEDEHLDETEMKGLERFKELLEEKWFDITKPLGLDR